MTMFTNIQEMIQQQTFTLHLRQRGYNFIGHTSDDDWEYQPGIYTEKAFGKHIVCYDPEQKIYYCKIKRNED
jgi:hypothetical protein